MRWKKECEKSGVFPNGPHGGNFSSTTEEGPFSKGEARMQKREKKGTPVAKDGEMLVHLRRGTAEKEKKVGLKPG